MNTSTKNQNEAAQPKPKSARKRIPSILDPFTEPLLQMDTEKKTLNEIIEWLKSQGMETATSTLSDFLISRRRRRQMKEQLNGEKDAVESFQEWSKENPNPTLEAVIERLKMLALSLSMQQEAAPEVLKLA